MTDLPADAPPDAPPAQAALIAKVSSFLESRIDALAQVLRADITPEAFVSVAKSAITRNPDLLDCVPMTLYGSLYDAAKLGLDIDPRTGEFWLIPRRNKELGGALECTGMIGYKGFITLAKRAEVIEHIETRVVYEDEVSQGLVKIDLAAGEVEHRWTFGDVDRSDEKIVGAYCCAWLPGVARPAIEPLTREMLEKRMKASGTRIRPGRPWHDWFPEMCRKSAVRALFGRGYFPLTAVANRPRKITIETPAISLAEALAVDDKHAAMRQDIPARVTVEAEPEAAPVGPVASGDVVEEPDEE